MLGLNLTILEGMNKYMDNPALNPMGGVPFRFGRYLPNALLAFQLLPEALHPLSITIDSIKREAEQNPRIGVVLERLILPPLQICIRDHRIKPLNSIPVLDHGQSAQMKLDLNG
jgi:hypothetical protein